MWNNLVDAPIKTGLSCATGVELQRGAEGAFGAEAANLEVWHCAEGLRRAEPCPSTEEEQDCRGSA